MPEIDLTALIKKINSLSPHLSPTFLATWLKPEIEKIIKQVRHNNLQDSATDAEYFVNPSKLLLLTDGSSGN
jgi:hypothetical protein